MSYTFVASFGHDVGLVERSLCPQPDPNLLDYCRIAYTAFYVGRDEESPEVVVFEQMVLQGDSPENIDEWVKKMKEHVSEELVGLLSISAALKRARHERERQNNNFS